MNSLSVLLPVYNAQHHLAANAHDLLELMGESRDPFELWILDDGSTDDTIDVALELSACYPQAHAVRHPVRLGLVESVQTGLDRTECELIALGVDDYELDPNDLRSLWKLRDIERRLQPSELLLDAPADRRLEKLLAWTPRRSRPAQKRRFQIIHRWAFEQFRLEHAAETVARIDLVRAGGEAFQPNLRAKVRQPLRQN